MSEILLIQEDATATIQGRAKGMMNMTHSQAPTLLMAQQRSMAALGIDFRKSWRHM